VSPLNHVAQFPVREVFSHCVVCAPAGHAAQLFDSQSSKHPTSPSHAVVTNGDAHKKTPVSSAKGTSNGARHAAHFALSCFSVVKNARHPVDAAPPAHAACASVRSCAAQTFCVVGGVTVVPDGQLGYGAGHVVSWFLQTRGESPTSHVEPAVVQSVHDAPPDPHAVFTKPASHVPWASQQPEQLAASHKGTQALAVHASSFGQAVQLAPPLPHAGTDVPATHVPAASQHPAQFAGPQGRVMHAPFEHSSPVVVQLEHVAPPVPHAPSCVPTAHTPLTQHPEHVPGPHVASQNPATHCAFVPHGVHATPPAPQSADAAPLSHVLPSQHPEQFDGPHVAATAHTPPVHCVPPVHALQVSPPIPQSESSVPLKQLLPSQQPAQLAELHGPLVWQTFPTHEAPAPHAMHDSPPKPHAPSSPPPTHVPLAQHPAQLDGLHAAAVEQLPFTHACPPTHVAHARPDAPQSFPFVPVWHRPFMSQHPKQFDDPHAVVVHTPPPATPGSATHCCDAPAHVMHASPSLPHAAVSVPEVHPLGLQQPAQLLALHPAASHAPPPSGSGAHAEPVVTQSEHCAPPVPHAVSCDPLTHTPRAQQPVHDGPQSLERHA
jgi:hypothetical protein